MESEDVFGDGHVMAVLELLAQEAPTRSFDDLLRRARRQAVGGESLHRLEQAVRTALDIRGTFEKQRRRESALVTMVDTLQEMTSQQDLDGRLTVVARHARRLLGFDMAYISLRLPDGSSYVHVSDGDTTALNVGLELGEGLGLGERAQKRSAPFWTPDYLADDRFPHSEQIDDVVGSEGLHAILVVPMTYDNRTVGALYGASRVVRHFAPDEISLLRSLADMSASVIEATRTVDRVRDELERIEEENSRLTTALTASRSLAEAQASLADMCLEGADLHTVVGTAAARLGDGAGLLLSDGSGRTLACAGDVPRADTATVVRAMVDTSTADSPVETADGLWAAQVSTGVESPGILLCRSPVPLGDEARRLLRFTARAAALVLLLRHNLATAAGPARDEFLDDLLSGAGHPPRRLVERARRLGVDPSAEHVVVVLRPEGGKQGEAAVWASSYAYRRSGLKTVRGDYVVLLLPGSAASDAARTAAAELSPLLGHSVTAGGAGPVRHLTAVGKAFVEARRSLDTLVALGGTGGAAAPEDLGFLGLLLSEDHDVNAFVTSTVGPVIAYDAQRSTALVHTLEAYFAAGGSPTRAAQDLHVHTNTVARRLDRVTELLGPDWQLPEAALEIQLALRLHRARETVSRGHEPPAQAEREA
ncbi:helix-turn-helix domain-containing protein [Streptomyces sp. NPDC056528]|uniref:helix-turn-helix domain-containing protein n=1 Tax=Streptomyces sp. NPDC056528 TaxID=3345854 RepID=UPI0036CEDE12